MIWIVNDVAHVCITFVLRVDAAEVNSASLALFSQLNKIHTVNIDKEDYYFVWKKFVEISLFSYNIG